MSQQSWSAIKALAESMRKIVGPHADAETLKKIDDAEAAADRHLAAKPVLTCRHGKNEFDECYEGGCLRSARPRPTSRAATGDGQ
jgi:hypothetical protein